MLQFLINLLTPIFEDMGVSPTDVATYVNNLGGYIYAILGTFVLSVVVIVAAQFVVKKGRRHLVSWGAALSWVLTVTILVNVICFGPMYNNLAPIINGGGSVSPESAAASETVIEKVGDEGIVLAENNGILPLSNTSKINVFGWAATNPIYGGTGSGSSSNEGNIDVLTSLKNAGFEINQEIIDLYTEYAPTRTLGGNVTSVTFTDWSLPEPPVDRYTTELMDNAKAFSDTAVIVLARSGGEGQDLPADMSKVIDGTVDDVRQTLANGNEGYNYYAAAYTNNSAAYDDFAPGESYLQLSQTERDMIDLVTGSFDKVILKECGLCCEIMREDGAMMRTPELMELAKRWDMKFITIKDLQNYRKCHEQLVDRVTTVKLPTKYGQFTAHGFVNRLNGEHHVALVKGNIGDGKDVLCRVHSECLTGDTFGSLRCDCGQQLASAMTQIEKEGRGILLYMRQEGRGIGLINKLRAYELQEQGSRAFWKEIRLMEQSWKWVWPSMAPEKSAPRISQEEKAEP